MPIYVLYRGRIIARQYKPAPPQHAASELPAPYVRFLERSIREAFDFGSVPLKLRVRKKNG